MNSNILRAIVTVSEKAANIARAIRHEEHLFSLLVQEKKDDEKNPKFLHDFKTLADVLVQELVKHDLGTEFPELIGHIYGEEINEFSCLDGDIVSLDIGRSEKETFNQLMRILGDERAAKSLASLVHSQIDPPDFEIPGNFPCLPLDEIGVWIDPIDSTAEYITGGQEMSSVDQVFQSGLPCVTVLIGAFHKGSGHPVLGVVNQPFYRLCDDRWKGMMIWGVSYGGVNISSVLPSQTLEDKVVIVSTSESVDVKSRLTEGGYKLVYAAGAGNKLMCVALGLVSAYVLSKPSTFYWDTCGPHAILCAQGGGIAEFTEALLGKVTQLKYCGGVGIKQCCNIQGFIAYSSNEVLNDLVSLLK